MNIRNIAILAGLIGLAGCVSACSQSQVTAALSTPAGQLFCAVQTSGGGTVVVALVNAEVTAAAPGAAPVAVMATGATEAQVNADCAAAKGVPVAPPAVPTTAVVAIVPPAAS